MSGVVTVIEVYVAIIGACLPMLAPVYRKLRHGDARSAVASQPQVAPTDGLATIGKISNRKRFQSSESGSFTRIDNDEHSLVPVTYGNSQRVDVSGPHDKQSSIAESEDIPLEGIRVKQDLTWSDHSSSKV